MCLSGCMYEKLPGDILCLGASHWLYVCEGNFCLTACVYLQTTLLCTRDTRIV